MIVAVLLARECKGLLVGESLNPRELESVREIVREDPDIEDVLSILTMHLGPHEVLLAMDLKFRGHISVEQVVNAIDRIEQKIRTRHPEIRRIFIEAESLLGAKPDPGQAA